MAVETMDQATDSADKSTSFHQPVQLPANGEAVKVESQANNDLPDRTQDPKKPKAQKQKTPKPPKDTSAARMPKPAKPKRENAPKSAPEDPDAMFKVGFLADVYQERPANSSGVKEVVTRCTEQLLCP